MTITVPKMRSDPDAVGRKNWLFSNTVRGNVLVTAQ